MTDWNELDAESTEPDYKLLRFILWGLIAFSVVVVSALLR